MRIWSFEALVVGCIAAQGVTAQLLDPTKNYCCRFDHQCGYHMCKSLIIEYCS